MFLELAEYGVYKFSAKFFSPRKFNFSEGFSLLIFSILEHFSTFAENWYTPYSAYSKTFLENRFFLKKPP